MVQHCDVPEVEIDGCSFMVRPVGSWVLESGNVVAEALAVSLDKPLEWAVWPAFDAVCASSLCSSLICLPFFSFFCAEVVAEPSPHDHRCKHNQRTNYAYDWSFPVILGGWVY